MTTNFVIETAQTIMSQIRANGDNVIFSWGFNRPSATSIDGMPSLSFLVNGFDFKGRIWVAYNEGSDTYKIFGQPRNMNTISVLQSESYCDTLASDLDRLIETGPKGTKFYNKHKH